MFENIRSLLLLLFENIIKLLHWDLVSYLLLQFRKLNYNLFLSLFHLETLFNETKLFCKLHDASDLARTKAGIGEAENYFFFGKRIHLNIPTFCVDTD